jgi:hypothetical protein
LIHLGSEAVAVLELRSLGNWKGSDCERLCRQPERRTGQPYSTVTDFARFRG